MIDAVLAAAALAVLHAFGGGFRFLSVVPRSRWLSAAGGVSVAYVFVHLLPEIAEAQEAVSDAAEGTLPFVERHAYLVALAGLVVFYGLEHAARRARQRSGGAGPEPGSAGVFWIHMASYGIYNALVGYLLLDRVDSSAGELAFFTIALGLHFAVNDFALRDQHRDVYVRVGRWLLAAAVFAGLALAAVVELSEATLGLLLAFLAGGVIMNVLKEELPESRESRLGAFLAGAAVYSAILLAV